MIDEQAGGQAEAKESFTPTQIRLLKIAVVGMGIIIVFALIAILARIFYLATARTSPGPASGVAQLAPNLRLALPAGAVVRNISIAGDRLAVHYDAASGSGIAVLDLAAGQPAVRIQIVPEVGR